MSKCFWRKWFLCQLFKTLCPMITSLIQLNCSAVSLIVFSLLLRWSSKSVSHSLWVIIPCWNFLQNGIHSFLLVLNYFLCSFAFLQLTRIPLNVLVLSCFKKTWGSTTTFSHKDYFQIEGFTMLIVQNFFPMIAFSQYMLCVFDFNRQFSWC